MNHVTARIKKEIENLLQNEVAVSAADIQLNMPADRQWGDLATNLAFVLAKKTKEKPIAVAQKLAAALAGKLTEFSDIKLAGGGFLNFFFKRDALFNELLRTGSAQQTAPGQKVIVEHTSINPNKSAHIGHLRNSCLGDTLARAYRFLGHEVEVQNYIDDTGIQIADVVWGLLHHQQKSLADIQRIPDLAGYLWRLYTEVSKLLAEDPQRAEARNRTHKKIEEKIDLEYEVSSYISQQVLLDHIRVMEFLGIRYDLLARESDIIALDFFTIAAAELKQKGIMFLSTDPAKRGCWVIHHDKENLEKIIVRSNGTITYVGKDIAYNMWKLGLLEKDFYYRPFFTYADGQSIFITASQPQPAPDRRFGNGGKALNVIDVRQAYLQSLIAQILESIGGRTQREFVHFSYEMVALTPRCAKELGFALSPEEEQKPYIEVSGRKGMAIKADDLLAQLVEKSLQEVRLRNPQLDEGSARAIARRIAVGALRYFMIKYNLNSVIAFDFKEALSFEGDTGPYLQYTLVRLNSILNKLEGGPPPSSASPLTLEILPEKEKTLYWEIVLQLSLLEHQVEHALERLEPAALASFAYSLCQKFNHYYHLFPVIAEKNERIKRLRLELIILFKRKLGHLLDIMGIPIPEKM